jgi:hypothetical protein
MTGIGWCQAVEVKARALRRAAPRRGLDGQDG